MLLTALVFISWDVYFTQKGFWGFSPEHLSGFRMLSLPIEEWLFFLVIPYASVFTFDVVKAYFKGIKGRQATQLINLVLLGFALIMVLVFRKRAYTLWTFCLMAILIIINEWFMRRPWMLWFYFSYLLVLFPFMIVDGILTGTGISGEVVWYNNSETMGIRIGTIPLEDVFYGFSMVLMNVTLYEFFQDRGLNPSGRHYIFRS